MKLKVEKNYKVKASVLGDYLDHPLYIELGYIEYSQTRARNVPLRQ